MRVMRRWEGGPARMGSKESRYVVGRVVDVRGRTERRRVSSVRLARRAIVRAIPTFSHVSNSDGWMEWTEGEACREGKRGRRERRREGREGRSMLGG